MRWVNMALMLVVLFTIACDTPSECRFKADKMGVDKQLCNTSDNRQRIQSKYSKFSREQIDTPPKKQINLAKEIEKLVDKISELEAEVLDCQEKLAGATGMGCDIPANMPPPLECDCERWKQ